MATDDVLASYDADVGLHGDLCTKVETLLKELLATGGVRVHSVASRVKERSSLERKLQRGIESYVALCDVTDVVGLRVITYFPDEVDAVADIVTAEFAIDGTNSVDKGETLEPDRFGYRSVHFVAKLNPERLASTENRRFKDCVFEIQIRSILQHAWAEIEHDLGYKSEVEVPRHLRRRFAQLAALLEVADDLFTAVRTDAQRYSDQIGKRMHDDTGDVLVDKESVTEYIMSSPLLRDIEDRIAAESGRRVSDRDHVYIGGQLATNLHAAGFTTVAELDHWLSHHAELLIAFTTRWIASLRAESLVPGLALLAAFFVRIGIGRDREAMRRALRASAVGVGDNPDPLIDAILRELDEAAADGLSPPPPE